MKLRSDVQRALDLMVAEAVRSEINGSMPLTGRLKNRQWWIKTAKKAADSLVKLMTHVDELEKYATQVMLCEYMIRDLLEEERELREVITEHGSAYLAALAIPALDQAKELKKCFDS